MKQPTFALSLSLVFAASAFACSGEPSPVIVGQISDGAARRALTLADANPETEPGDLINVRINDDARRVRVDEDGGFVVQDLPIGDLSFTIEGPDISGTITLHDVTAAEEIEISVTMGNGELSIRVVRRQTRTPEPMPEPEQHGGPIHIKGHDVVHYLDARTYHGDVKIKGSSVTLVGPSGCNIEGRAIIDGDLEVKGNNVRIINVVVLGRTKIHGSNVRILDGCGDYEYDED